MEKKWYMMRWNWRDHIGEFHADQLVLNWLNTNKLKPEDCKINLSIDDVIGVKYITVHYFSEKELPLLT